MTVSAGWLWEMRSAIAAKVRDRNPMEIADDLGHRFWRLLPYGRQPANYRMVALIEMLDARHQPPCSSVKHCCGGGTQARLLRSNLVLGEA